jgi:hypothetical protein
MRHPMRPHLLCRSCLPQVTVEKQEEEENLDFLNDFGAPPENTTLCTEPHASIQAAMRPFSRAPMHRRAVSSGCRS